MQDLPFAKKSLGQHWLTDSAMLDAIANAASLTAKDVVLEIGPGTGTLTKVLCERVKKVIAVEFDEQLASELATKVPAANLQVVHQDILRFDLTSLPPDYKVVANIPYYLTSNLIRVLSETPNQPVAAVLLVQKEVAERVAAAPGGMSLLSVTAQYYWEVSAEIVVPARLFMPPPKVDSQVLVLQRRSHNLFEDVDTRAFFRLVKAGFSNRRKTLLNSLSGGLQMGKEQTRELLESALLFPASRPQELSLEDWHRLYEQKNGTNT